MPADTRSVALVVTDPDAPGGTFVHLVAYDLPGRDGRITDGQWPPGTHLAANSDGGRGWYAPCPPSGTHRYRFTVYALGARVGAGSTQQVLDAIEPSATARGTLTGLVTHG